MPTKLAVSGIIATAVALPVIAFNVLSPVNNHVVHQLAPGDNFEIGDVQNPAKSNIFNAGVLPVHDYAISPENVHQTAQRIENESSLATRFTCVDGIESFHGKNPSREESKVSTGQKTCVVTWLGIDQGVAWLSPEDNVNTFIEIYVK